MTITTYTEFDQNSDLWFLARLGLPTASCFKLIMSKGVGQKESVRRSDYINDLVAELKYGEPVAQYKYRNQYMERGHEWEPEALEAYVDQSDEPVQTVGFIRNNQLMLGCSPDALVGDDGGVEIKTLLPGLMIKHVRAGRGAPAEHIAQLQGCMLVTGRQWWDLVLYTRGEICIEHVGRDESYLEELKRFLGPFQAELEKAVFEATQEQHTWRALRALRDRQFSERLEEEREMVNRPLPNLAEVAEDLATPPVSAITEALQRSLEREKFLEETDD